MRCENPSNFFAKSCHFTNKEEMAKIKLSENEIYQNYAPKYSLTDILQTIEQKYGLFFECAANITLSTGLKTGGKN